MNTPLLPSTLCVGKGGPAQTVLTEKRITPNIISDIFSAPAKLFTAILLQTVFCPFFVLLLLLPFTFLSFVLPPFLSFMCFHPNKKAGKRSLSRCPPMLVKVRFYCIEYQTSSCLVSNGPRSISTFTWYLPLKFSGTRHEYRQVPPQPYAKLPVASTFPASSTIFSSGAGCRSPFFCTPGW